jgi:hypothetical protein
MDDVEHVMEQPITTSEQPEVATQESTEPAKETQQSNEQEDTNARNWKRANEARKRLENELRKKDDEVAELRKLVYQKLEQPKEVDELESISGEEFIPKAKIEKLWDKRERRLREETKKEIEASFQEREKSRWLERIRTKYPDFEDVVNVETLSILEEQEPDVAETIADLKDPYKVGIQSYKYIKALGLTNKVDTSKRHKEVEKKLEENKKTLQSPQVYDKRPLAQAYKITDADHKALYKEMMESAGMAGFSF